MRNMFCSKCGKEIQEGNVFCGNCGTLVETKGKGKTKAKIPVAVIVVSTILIVIGVVVAIWVMGRNDVSPAANTDSNENLSASHPEEEKPDYLSQLVEYETAQYSYTGLNSLDLSVRNYTPNQKQEGMDWDSTLFYSLEDVYADSTEDNQIAYYMVSIYEFLNAQSGNGIRCFVYKNADNGQINKIVTVEQQDEGYLVSDYYYDNGKVNFVFTRTVDVYTPTYATIDKVGNRYYFNNDVMVRYRTIEMPRQIVQQTLNPTITWYPNTSYFTMNSEEIAKYDAIEYQVLNEAYNVYNAVQNQQNIYEMKGYVYSKEGTPLTNVSIAIIDSADNTVLYSGETAEGGSYHIYVSLDNRNCYLQVYLEGYLPVYIYDVELNSGLLGNFASCIYLPEIESAQTEAKLYLYNSFELTGDENAAPLQNAQVVIRSGLNAKDGEIVVKGNTSETGVFETTLTPGAYTAEYTLDGYATTYENFYVTTNVCIVKGYTVTAISDNTEKIVLCWDSDIDLDLVLYTPEKSVYGDMNCVNIRQPLDKYNNLLVADAFGSRCEVLNISNQLDGQYRIFVNDYTNYQNGTYDANALAMSGARVYIYSSKGLIAVYYIDASQSGIVWNVCEKERGYYPCSIVSSDINKYSAIDKSNDKKMAALQAYEEFLVGERKAIVVNEIKDYENERGIFLLTNQYGKNEIINNFRNVYGCYFDGSVSEEFALIDHNSDGIPEMVYYLDDLGYYGWNAYYIRMNETYELELYGVVTGNFREYSTIYENGMYSNSFVYFWDYGTDYYAIDYESGQSNMLASFTITEYDTDETADNGLMFYKKIYIPNLNEWDNEAVQEDYDKAMNEIINPLCQQFSEEFCGGVVEMYEIEESSIQNNLNWE